MSTNRSDDVRYLRDSVEAYRRRFLTESDETVRRYLWERIVEFEAALSARGALHAPARRTSAMLASQEGARQDGR